MNAPPTLVPAWVDEQMPYHGECALCGYRGYRDARHQILDAIAGQIRAGDPVTAVADDYELPVEFCQRIADEWEVSA